MLTDIRTQVENRRIVPVYPPAVQSLDQRQQRIQGFMMPLEPGEQQRHFLLSSVPLMILYFVAQRYMVQGMTAGSVKG